MAQSCSKGLPVLEEICFAEIDQPTMLSSALESVRMLSSLVGVVTSALQLAVPCWDTSSEASSFQSSLVQGNYIDTIRNEGQGSMMP